MTEAEVQAVELLRAHGFAVVALTPAELGGVDAARVEDRLYETGANVIGVLAALDAPDNAPDDGDARPHEAQVL